MLGALCVRIQSLYSVHFMKDCDKLVYEFRRELVITFAKKNKFIYKITLRAFQSLYIIVLIFADYLPLQRLIVRRQFGILLSNIP